MEKDIYSEKLSAGDFSQICRNCFSKNNITRIGNNILEILKILIPNIEVDLDDELPNQICLDCITKLEDINCFITLIKNNDSYLRRILEISKNKDDLQDDIPPVHYLEEYNLNDCCDNECSIDPCDIKDELCSHNTIEKVEKDYQKFECNECGRFFLKKSNFQLHLRSHTKESPHECKICMKRFRYAPNLKRHENIVHKGLKPYKCETCDKEFATLLRKTEHTRIHTGERPYICNMCGSSFKKYSTYHAHEKLHKIKNGLIPKSNKVTKRYSRKPPDLSQLVCELCRKSFSSKQALLLHEKIHSGEKSFLCSECGKSFIRKSHLEVHFRIHTGEKPFECSDCSKNFRQLAAYRNHLLIHKNERLFKCEICQKNFIQLGHLQNHMKTHTGEKPYKCSFCNKAFSQNGNLRAHTRIHTNERPYRCVVCYVGFYDSSSLKKHRKNHNIEEVKTEPLNTK